MTDPAHYTTRRTGFFARHIRHLGRPTSRLVAQVESRCGPITVQHHVQDQLCVALVVHRSQGATVARAHALEDGGGRELAYVKMSRARECSTVYVVADSLDQATEDLSRSWAQSRRIGWAIDRGTPAPGVELERSLSRSPVVSASLRHARLVAEREAVAAVIPADPGVDYSKAQSRVQRLTWQLNHLDAVDGHGAWRGTALGEAAIAWKRVSGERCRGARKM